jgi:hypothetical protein
MPKLPAALNASTIEGQVVSEVDDRQVGIATIRGREVKMYWFTNDQKIGFMSLFRSLEREPNLTRMVRYFDVLNRQAQDPEDMDWLDDQVMFEGLTYEEIIPQLLQAMGFTDQEAPKTGPQKRARRAGR